MRCDRLIQREPIPASASLGRILASRMFDQDLSHGRCRQGHEMSPVFPGGLGLIDKSKKNFMDKCGGLEGMIGSLPAHVRTRQPMQFVIDDRK